MKINSVLGLVLAVFLLCIFFPPSAKCAFFDVGTGWPYVTIQDAINAAGYGDTIRIADGTYTGVGNKNLNLQSKALTITSFNGNQNCIIDLEDSGNFINGGIDSTSGTVIRSLSIHSGYHVIGTNGATVTIEKCKISNFHTVTNGAIYAVGGYITIKNTDIYSGWNSAWGVNVSSGTLFNCKIYNNDGYGVAIGAGSVDSCSIYGNGDSGIYISDVGEITVSNCNINNNEKGIEVWRGASTNQYLVKINKSEIADNTNEGIAFFDDTNANSEVIGCQIYGNKWGISVWGVEDLLIDRTVIRENGSGATMTGSGVFFDSCPDSHTALIRNSIIYGNSSILGGAAIDVGNPWEVTVLNSTIADNTASAPNGIGCAIEGNGTTPSVFLKNTIVWGNTNTYPQLRYVSATYSLVEDGWPGTENIDQDPLFKGTGDYHISKDSPCIDSGTLNGAPEKDFDDNRRPIGSGVDIGADEYFPFSANLPSINQLLLN